MLDIGFRGTALSTPLRDHSNNERYFTLTNAFFFLGSSSSMSVCGRRSPAYVSMG
jgi:hypothetical protein